MADGGSSTLVKEWLVGASIAVILIALTLPISTEWKVVAIGTLAVEGGLLILMLSGRWRALAWRLGRRRREARIRKHPDFAVELYRLERRIHEVLYERNSARPSLRLQGVDAMEALSPADDRLLAQEFLEKVDIMNRSLSDLHRRIDERRNGRDRDWRTSEFVDGVRAISAHLELVAPAVATVHRQAARFVQNALDHGRTPQLPPAAIHAWEAFRTDFNAVLGEWKAFTQRFDQAIGYGVQTNAMAITQL